MVLGTLGTAGCNLWAWEGGETHPASLEPAEPVQLRESHRAASGAPCTEVGATEQAPSLSFSLCQSNSSWALRYTICTRAAQVDGELPSYWLRSCLRAAL